jgi:hypothetical protein
VEAAATRDARVARAVWYSVGRGSFWWLHYPYRHPAAPPRAANGSKIQSRSSSVLSSSNPKSLPPPPPPPPPPHSGTHAQTHRRAPSLPCARPERARATRGGRARARGGTGASRCPGPRAPATRRHDRPAARGAARARAPRRAQQGPRGPPRRAHPLEAACRPLLRLAAQKGAGRECPAQTGGWVSIPCKCRAASPRGGGAGGRRGRTPGRHRRHPRCPRARAPPPRDLRPEKITRRVHLVRKEERDVSS